MGLVKAIEEYSNQDFTEATKRQKILAKLLEEPIETHLRKHYTNLGILNLDMRALNEENIEFIVFKIKDVLK